jgi:hypothetical protein
MSHSYDLDKLRRALEAPDGFDRFEHRKRTESLRESFPHSVNYRDLVNGTTCLTYALGLFKHPTYLAIAGGFFNYEIFAGRLFVEWLLEGAHLNETTHPAPGCLVLYFADEVWRHAGMGAVGQRVISQWGTFPVYDHELFEVPASYGNHARYFLVPDPEKTLALFVEFAKYHYRLSDEDIAEAIQYDA